MWQLWLIVAGVFFIGEIFTVRFSNILAWYWSFTFNDS